MTESQSKRNPKNRRTGTHPSIAQMVANQMMKGPKPGRIKATKFQQEMFFIKHEAKINLILENIPRCSAAVGAVLTKCLIKYGEAETLKFCHALKHGNFNGVFDPVHLLWKFLNNTKKKETLEIYQKTLYATKSYFEKKTIDQLYLRPLMEDIFEWDAGMTIPDEYLVGNVEK